MNEYEQYDLKTLLSKYMEEAKAFSEAISKGESWQVLREKRIRIQQLNEQINKKYKEGYRQGRRRDGYSPDRSHH